MDLNFTQSIILENDRVRLEPLNHNHIDALLPIALKHPNLLQYSPTPFGNKAALKLYVDTVLNDRSKETHYAFAIYDKTEKRYVGSTSYGNVSNKNQRLEIGWTWIEKAVQGTGLNKNCKFLLLTYAFEVLEFERVELKTDARNLQSRRAIEKIGGQYEGTLRSHTLMLDGHRRDTVYYGFVKGEWAGIRGTIFKEFE